MFKNTLMLMIFISNLMMFTKNPLYMTLILFIQIILSCFIIRLIIYSSWLSFTIFLIMVSGLMIIFLYITSLCSNNKFTKISLINIISTGPIYIMFNHLKEILMYQDNLNLKNNFMNSFIELYTHFNMKMSILMLFYLLIILLIMINFLNKTKGPMRKKY
uniref:NADH dehydrogenase subunit 6 n=1 Tax=Leptynoptera sulfurea TaxID=1950150 RepID=A0A344A2H9_9HEMI|nr:NADH dehydrogenase subunit 6 [Leptynoptera sulfurea]AWU48970.1 NADH dehydrogenase subunit 6 [Leptynoptera sulfurea]